MKPEHPDQPLKASTTFTAADKPAAESHAPDEVSDTDLSGDLRRLRRAAKDTDSFTAQDLVAHFGDESRLLLMIVLCVLNIVLSPLPGQSAVFGLLLLMVSWVELRDKKLPRLPEKIAHVKIESAYVQKMLHYMQRTHGVASRFLHGRLLFLQTPPMRLITNLCFLWMSFVIFLPIPFGNTIAAIGIIFMAAGQAERDGVWILTGWLVAAAHLVLPIWAVNWLLHQDFAQYLHW